MPSSNSTSTASSPPSPAASSTPAPSSASSPSANSIPTSVSTPPSSSTSNSLITTPSSSSTPQSSPSSSSSSSKSTPSSTPSSTSQSSTTSSASPVTSTITQTPTSPGGSTVTTVVTSVQTPDTVASQTPSSASSSSSSSGTAGLVTSAKSTSGHGLGTGGTIAVAVVVPIVAVALLLLAGLFLWRKRKARKDAEELRRKEVEEYGYNPNNDPTLPAIGAAGDGPFEMREDGSSGYRGWGTTAVASSGRKASTTLSGGQSAGGIGVAHSEGTSPTQGPVSDTRSDNPLVDGQGRPLSGEQEALGALGPAASANRNGDINRGPSNASSSYSAANRSDGSGDAPAGGNYYNNQYDAGNPYGEPAYGSPPGRAEMSGQPIIRDVQARRNTRIENPSHFPQQSAGISQNF